MTRFMQAKVLSLAAAAVVACAAAAPALAAPNLVTNGGFETGSLAGWSQFGDTSFSGAFCPGGTQVSEGICSAFFGPSLPGGISQTIAVQAGEYVIQFDLAYETTLGLAASNFFSASFDGQTLMTLLDQPEGPFQHYLFKVYETSAHDADLVFTFQNNPSFTYLDGVSVTVPEPASLALLGLGLAGLGFSRRKMS